jgi:hypothetical protein
MGPWNSTLNISGSLEVWQLGAPDPLTCVQAAEKSASSKICMYRKVVDKVAKVFCGPRAVSPKKAMLVVS